jgi:hypothetical protein
MYSTANRNFFFFDPNYPDIRIDENVLYSERLNCFYASFRNSLPFKIPTFPKHQYSVVASTLSSSSPRDSLSLRLKWRIYFLHERQLNVATTYHYQYNHLHIAGQ